MFKVGDKIKIREDLEDGKMYGGVDFIPYMSEFLGKEATITGIDEDGDFLLDTDWGMFLWSTEMFESKTEIKSETLTDVMKEAVSESEVLRLSKAVIEYENIVHELETEVDYYETKYIDLVEKYNVLVEKHNSLLEELKEDYI